MPNFAFLLAVSTAFVGLLLAGCATTAVQLSGKPLQQPLCGAGHRPSAVLFWMPQWRADQKEPHVREALAQRGIQRFVAQQDCLRFSEVARLPGEVETPSNDALLRRVNEAQPTPELVLLVVVRELGPRLLLGLPMLVEGGTEVVIEVRALRTATAELLMDSRIQWRNGGTFIIKGIGSLDADLSAALISAVLPAAPSQRRLLGE